MSRIYKNKMLFGRIKRLISPVVFFSLLLSMLMYSCDCDNNPLPNWFNPQRGRTTGLYITRIQIDKRNVNLNSFSGAISNVSLRPSPLASFSFSFPVSSINIDSIKKYLSIINNGDKMELPFILRQGANDSTVYIELPAGVSLDRSRSYDIKLREGLSVETTDNKKYTLNNSYSFNFKSASKDNNTNLSVSYLGKNIVASDADVFTIEADFKTLPSSAPLKFRVDPSSKVSVGNTDLTVVGDSVQYLFDVNGPLNERTITVTAEDGSKKEYKIVVKTRQYTVTFNTDGGSSVAPQQVASGAKATLPSPPPTKSGLYLAGWFTKANGNPSDTFSFIGAISSDTTLYAKWVGPFEHIVQLGRIPDDISQYDDPLVKETLGNGNYQAGANIVIKHVKYGGNDNNDGSSWSKAAGNVKTVLGNITDASPSKIYLVMVAVSPNEYISGDFIRMKNNTAIIGGFAAAQDGDYTMSQTDTTILSGNNASRVFLNANLDLSALLYGVKIIKGAAGSSGAGSGAGMFNNNASVTVTNVIFSENSTATGSAVHVFRGSKGIFKNTLIINNAPGPAVRIEGSSPVFVNTIFANNGSSPNGSAVLLLSTSNPIFINANFSGNMTQSSTGTAIYADKACNCFPIVANSIFSSPDNSANPQTIFLDPPNNATNNTYNNLFLSNGYIYNGKNAIDPAMSTTRSPYIIYENMTEQPPSEGSLGANGGFISTMPIPSGSSAVDLGLYAKVAAGNVVYFSEDKISWFQIGAMGEHVAATPPADAKDLTDTDARGYKRIGRPDAGAYEAGATP